MKLRYIKEYSEYGSGDFAAFDNDNDEPFWGNTAAGVLPYSTETKKILINYRSKYVNEPHTWGIWGGKVDDEEQIENTVIREFEEETQYTGEIKLIPAYIFKNNNGTFQYFNFIGIIENEFTPTLNWESENFKWVTLDELIVQENKHFGLNSLLEDNKTMNILKSL